ncbi:ABC-three component system protein [Limnohabitans sp.]
MHYSLIERGASDHENIRGHVDKKIQQNMSVESNLTAMHSAESPIVDVVFIHGLTGDAKETWVSGPKAEFWPLWLVKNLSRLNIYSLGYPSSLFSAINKVEMDLAERANNILELLAGKRIGTRPVVFVAHSLGGIIVKALLRRALESGDKDFEVIAESTRRVIFLATPHKGASLASTLNLMPKSSKQIQLLANDQGFLEDLNQFYRNFALKRTDFSTITYYEKIKTNGVLVVDKDSADSGAAGPAPVAVDRNHIDICKPSDEDDIVFLGVSRHLGNLCSSLKVNAQVEEFSSKSDLDRRDLLQKLIDAGREHEYQYANNAQNKFARKMVKNGLFSSAKNDYEQLLSDACTRFTMHVYHPLICKGEPDSLVLQALQNDVIAPLANKACGGSVFTENEVLNSLYFLTEQCHISWDYKK